LATGDIALAFGDRVMVRKQALSVTDAAAQRIQALLAKRDKPSAGVRIGVRSRGCSGLSYTLEYADEKGKFDEVVEEKGVTILIDPKAVMFILGTEMDYVEEKLQSGFTFQNPNEKGRCGCGESFHV
jgi:iron-sulfur cluster assembly protein